MKKTTDVTPAQAAEAKELGAAVADILADVESLDSETALYVMLAATVFLYHRHDGLGIEAASDDFQRVIHALKRPKKSELS